MDYTKPIRLAVIGTGLMGRKHAELIGSHTACSLVGLCDIDPGRASMAAEFKVPYYQDVEELLEREKPHGVIIATPNDTHANIAEICASHSAHILIEKPIANTLDEARRIVRAADEASIRVLVGHHRRHNPFIQKARALVRGGDLGKLVGVSMLWALLKPANYYQVDWRRRRPGGGPTFINLIHEFDSLRFICGEIRQIYAQSSSAARNLEVEDSLSISLTFENGVLGTILASDATPSPWSYEATTRENPLYFHTDESCYHFLGTQGSLAFPQMTLWRYVDNKSAGWQHPLEKSAYHVPPTDPLVTQLDHFCRVIKGGEEPLIDGRDGTQSLAVALAVLESIRDQTPVEVIAT